MDVFEEAVSDYCDKVTKWCDSAQRMNRYIIAQHALRDIEKPLTRPEAKISLEDWKAVIVNRLNDVFVQEVARICLHAHCVRYNRLKVNGKQCTSVIGPKMKTSEQATAVFQKVHDAVQLIMASTGTFQDMKNNNMLQTSGPFHTFQTSIEDYRTITLIMVAACPIDKYCCRMVKNLLESFCNEIRYRLVRNYTPVQYITKTLDFKVVFKGWITEIPSDVQPQAQTRENFIKLLNDNHVRNVTRFIISKQKTDKKTDKKTTKQKQIIISGEEIRKMASQVLDQFGSDDVKLMGDNGDSKDDIIRQLLTVAYATVNSTYEKQVNRKLLAYRKNEEEDLLTALGDVTVSCPAQNDTVNYIVPCSSTCSWNRFIRHLHNEHVREVLSFVVCRSLVPETQRTILIKNDDVRSMIGQVKANLKNKSPLDVKIQTDKETEEEVHVSADKQNFETNSSFAARMLITVAYATVNTKFNEIVASKLQKLGNKYYPKRERTSGGPVWR
jgi:hypothetical protein